MIPSISHRKSIFLHKIYKNDVNKKYHQNGSLLLDGKIGSQISRSCGPNTELSKNTIKIT